MKNRTLTVSVLTAASLGLGLAAASGALAHPGGGHGGPEAQGNVARSGPEAVGPQARGGRGDRARGRRGIGRRGAQCSIADDKLRTAANDDRLERLKERLDERVAEDEISQRRADMIFARRQKMVTIKVERMTAALQPVLALLGVNSKTALRAAAKDAGGMRDLLESKNIEIADFRAAKREGRQSAREAVQALCSSGEKETGETTSRPAV